MNTNKNARVVLCYGDSNTWGQNDDKNVAGRYDAESRWTGILQKQLGEDYYVIEEGLGGRTTDLEHYNPAKPSRNGFTYFVPCLTSHSPLDWVVIMLGTNDLKMQYSRSVEDIAKALNKYVDTIRGEQPQAKILLVSPIYVDSSAPKFSEYYFDTYDEVSEAKSKELASSIEKLASDTDCLFLDASKTSKVGFDGIHFGIASHPTLAESIREKIVNSN